MMKSEVWLYGNLIAILIQQIWEKWDILMENKKIVIDNSVVVSVWWGNLLEAGGQEEKEIALF